MQSDPTPLQRLLYLEKTLAAFQAAQLPDQVRQPLYESSARVIWPSDELLLIRLLRRSPDVLTAYRAPAELLDTEDQSLRLIRSNQASPFYFCELLSRDAVVWLATPTPDWIWSSSIFMRLFDPLPAGYNGESCIIHTLPLFSSIENGQSWKLVRRGKFVTQLNLIPEQAEQAQLLRRISLLEQQFLQQRIKSDAEIQELRVHVRVQQEQIDRLLKLYSIRNPSE